MFYAANMHRASAPFLRALGADAERWAAKLEREGESGVVLLADAASSSQKQVGQQVPRDDRREAPLVVELS
jgi:hypothetical protein